MFPDTANVFLEAKSTPFESLVYIWVEQVSGTSLLQKFHRGQLSLTFNSNLIGRLAASTEYPWAVLFMDELS